VTIEYDNRPFLTPGTLYCSDRPALISTVLGSCVAVCLIDRYNRAAAMNHFVLPYDLADGDSLRYGDASLDRMLTAMIRLGCDPGSLKAKVFGGAAVLPFGEAKDTVGVKNVDVAIGWLRDRAIPVAGRRTGGKVGLLIRFDTVDSSVLVRAIAASHGPHISGPITTFDSRTDFIPFYD
jgi:chemotaxis protein CheD